MIANDGGSYVCGSCNTLFHQCGNVVKVGSPGPKLCDDCDDRRNVGGFSYVVSCNSCGAGLSINDVDVSGIHIYTTCPYCNHVSIRKSTA